jgi:DNA-binding winged helix-turn-helix (wHTH) protein
MQETRVLEFGPFRLDLVAERLWREAQAVPLTAKAFAVLCYLVRHAGRLVTRDELIAAVWGLPAVSDAALTVCMGEIRRALGDTARPPQFLETVRGRGYRFGTAVRVGPSPLGVGAGVPGRRRAGRPTSWWGGRRSWGSCSSAGPRRVRAAGR